MFCFVTILPSDCSFIQAIARYEKKRWKKYLIEMIDYYIIRVHRECICRCTKTMLGVMPGCKDRTTYRSLPLIKPASIINGIALTLCKADVQFERIQYLCNVSSASWGGGKCFPLQD